MEISGDQKYKVGSRGHVGSSPLDLDCSDERTIAAMLGMPQLALWEFVRDQVAEKLLQSHYLAGLITGSLPLQVPNIPFNGTLVLRHEGADSALIQGLPSRFTIDCSSLYEELGFGSYTEVGWQLALPRVFAYSAWDNANDTRDIVADYVTDIAALLGNATNHDISEENATRILDALNWGLSKLYAAISHANISTLTFNTTIDIPGCPAPVSLDIAVDFRKLLGLMPVKIVASSSDALAGITAYDKYWDENGYRSVYFSFEIEALSTTDLAEQLMINAIEWTTDWDQLSTTELLGNLVRVSEETADLFNSIFDAIPGTTAFENGTLLTEDGYVEFEVSLSEGTLCNLVIAHPTCEKVSISILEGNGEVVIQLDGIDNVTKATVTASTSGIIRIGVQADPDSSLNPAYIALKTDGYPATWDQTPTNQVVEYGQSFRYDLNASDPSGIDHWWLNDTTHFAIDSHGVITNVTMLVVDTYWLQVWVNDTYGNVQTVIFKVTVQDTITTTTTAPTTTTTTTTATMTTTALTPLGDLSTMIAIAGGIGGVVVVIIVILTFKKKR